MKIYFSYPAAACILLILFIAASCEKEIFVEPKQDSSGTETGRLIIESRPAGASIYIDGKNTGFITPDTLKWLTAGAQTITLKKHLFWDTTFTAVPSNTAPVPMVIDYYASERMLGTIVCNSTPQGAAVYLNGTNTGKVTPAILNKLIPQEYNVVFDYPEYRKDSVKVALESRMTSNVSVILDDTLDIIKYTTLNSAIPSNVITGIAEDKQGNIWIGTGNMGLVKYDGKKFTNYRAGSAPFVKSDFISRVKSDADRNVWVAFSSALSRYDGNEWISTPSGFISNIVFCRNNIVLAANDRFGIIKYSNGQFSTITQAQQGMPENEVTSMCYDAEGKLWAAFRTGRIGIYDGTSWSFQEFPNYNMPYNFCLGLNLSADGKMLAIFYNRPNGPAATAAHLLCYFEKNVNAWISISGSYTAHVDEKDLYIDSGNRTWYTLNSPYPVIARINNISFAREFLSNTILIGGIRKFSDWLWQDKLLFFTGKQVFIDSKQNLWVFGGEGMIKVKAGRWFNN